MENIALNKNIKFKKKICKINYQARVCIKTLFLHFYV